ncbi:Uncharacterised protein [Salmonella enterica]|nr:Uncharacterised protein [Salmonella enterica]VFS06270.1 Uncharacterised protein [Salmonella enterica subsp. houtenae]
MTTRSAGICEQEIERLKVDHVEGTCIFPGVVISYHHMKQSELHRGNIKDQLCG